MFCLSVGARAQDVPSARGEVVFLVPQEVPEEELDELRSALLAQFAGTQTALRIERAPRDPADLRAQVRQARLAAAQHGALGVFWLDTADQGDWLLYLTEPAGDRVLVRRIQRSESTAAAFEAVSVIAQRSASALAAGETIGMRPVRVPEAEAPAPPPEPPAVTPRPSEKPPRAVPVVQAGYRGETYAPEVPWQSGADLAAGVLTAVGVYAGAGVVLFPVLRVERELALFEVTRLPVEVTLGLQSRGRTFRVGGELVPFLSVVRRQVLLGAEGLSASPADRRTLFGVSPRVRLDVRPAAYVGLYAKAGVNVIFNNFDYVADVDGVNETLLEPFPVRFVGEVGLTFGP